jgi:septum site-determining protein MinC
MYLREVDLAAIAAHLAAKIRQAPGFFLHMPVVIDLEWLADTVVMVDFPALTRLLREHGMIPVGVRHGGADLQAAAAQAGLPVLVDSRTAAGQRTNLVEANPPRRSRIVTQPVRSGQQIYAAQGDLIVLGAISPGAEVLAEGNIHVYGPLRGRALAGVKGDLEARIFCQSLEAELISIAGHYRVIEQVDEAYRDKPVQMYLAEDRLLIETLAKPQVNN